MYKYTYIYFCAPISTGTIGLVLSTVIVGQFFFAEKYNKRRVTTLSEVLCANNTEIIVYSNFILL